jgi:hypothetical protein
MPKDDVRAVRESQPSSSCSEIANWPHQHSLAFLHSGTFLPAYTNIWTISLERSMRIAEYIPRNWTYFGQLFEDVGSEMIGVFPHHSKQGPADGAGLSRIEVTQATVLFPPEGWHCSRTDFHISLAGKCQMCAQKGHGGRRCRVDIRAKLKSSRIQLSIEASEWNNLDMRVMRKRICSRNLDGTHRGRSVGQRVGKSLRLTV